MAQTGLLRKRNKRRQAMATWVGPGIRFAAVTDSAIAIEGEFRRAHCCFCGRGTSEGPEGDGVRLSLARGGPSVFMVVIAHIECLSTRMTPELAGYLAEALEAWSELQSGEL